MQQSAPALGTQHLCLSSYLPPQLVEAYRAMGKDHALYEWQV